MKHGSVGLVGRSAVVVASSCSSGFGGSGESRIVELPTQDYKISKSPSKNVLKADLLPKFERCEYNAFNTKDS